MTAMYVPYIIYIYAIRHIISKDFWFFENIQIVSLHFDCEIVENEWFSKNQSPTTYSTPTIYIY